MAGSKRNKLKKVLSPSQSTASPPSDLVADDDELMNDLMAQLDSKDTNVQSESAEVLKDMQTNQNIDLAEEASKKKDPKSRYQERQVSVIGLLQSHRFLTFYQARKAEKLSKTFSPVDEAADERLKKVAQDEEKSIKRTCDELGVKIYEVSSTAYDHYSEE